MKVSNTLLMVGVCNYLLLGFNLFMFIKMEWIINLVVMLLNLLIAGICFYISGKTNVIELLEDIIK